jgi:hypothetical protein
MTIPGPSDVAVARDDRQRARRGLALFFALVIVFEAVVITAMVVTGMYALVVALMWSVALASVIARLVLREGVADVSFRLVDGAASAGSSSRCSSRSSSGSSRSARLADRPRALHVDGGGLLDDLARRLHRRHAGQLRLRGR